MEEVTVNDLNFDDDDFLDDATFEESGDTFNGGGFGDSDDSYIVDVDDNDDDFNLSESVDAITQLLNSKGISDVNRIKFENENGDIEERAWKDLDEEEKYNILKDTPTSLIDDLDDDELDLINRIRLSRMSVNDYLGFERLKGVNAYVNSQNALNEPTYIVDDYSDDDLFMLDLQTKVEDISDEDLISALEAAKSNPTVFEKQVQGLRNEYKRLEEERNERELAIANQEKQEKFDRFSNSIISSINNFNNLGELDITMEDSDADELYDFITGTDAAGVNHFYKALNDPDTLTRVAWFALHGEDVINSISNYYKNAIAQSSRQNYEKGYNEALLGKKPSVVVAQRKNKSNNRKVASVDDLTY